MHLKWDLIKGYLIDPNIVISYLLVRCPFMAQLAVATMESVIGTSAL